MRSWILIVAAIQVAAASAMAAGKEPKGRARPEVKDSADAQPASPRDVKERAAKKACLTGDPAKGVDLLTDLFIDSNDPTYIFNQGRCYEQSNQFENAIGRFREYLRKAKQASETDKNEAKAHISDCLRLLGKKDTEVAETAGADSGPVASEPVPAVPVPAPPPAPTEPAGISARSLAPAHDGRAGKGLRAAGVVTASVGAAAVIAGAVFNLQHNSIVKNLSDHYRESDESRGQTYKTLAIVGYAGGAACIVGGAVLYVLGWNAGRVTVSPSIGVGDAGAVLGGTF